MKKQRTKVHEHLYEKRSGDVCYYCGDPFEHGDHCPPIKWVRQLGPDHPAFADSEWAVVPSCAECNYLLGAKDLFTLGERIRFVYHHLQVNEWNLRMQEPESIEQINENYTGRLREEMKAHALRKYRAWLRFEYAERKAHAVRNT
jgi:hypothetical protein